MANNTSKDYYKILEVTDNASQLEIKKSYRRLAMKHHPDKNANNKSAELMFKDIQEAYYTLSHEKRRQQYNHDRFDKRHGLNQKPNADVTNIEALVKKAARLKKSVQQMDPHRINKDALYNSIQLLLSPKNMAIIMGDVNDKKISRIIDDILDSSKPLLFKQVKQVCIQLATIAGTQNYIHQKIYAFQKKQQANETWNNYHPLIAIVSVILFCMLIYMISR